MRKIRYRKQIWLSGFIVFSLIISVSKDGFAQKSLHIFFTGGLQGFVKSGDPEAHGDALRLAATVRDIMRRDRLTRDQTLIFDTGDALAYHYLAKLDSGQTIVRTLAGAGFDGMTLGNLDFAYGRQNLQRLAESHRQFAMFASNISTTDGQPFLARYRIYERGGLRIGVVGAISAEVKNAILADHLSGLKITPAQNAIRALVDSLRSRCDMIIAVNHASFADNVEIARAVSGLDILIGWPGGDWQQFVQVRSTENRRQTTVVRAAYQALEIGHLEVKLSAPGKVDSVLLRPFETTNRPESELDLTGYNQLEQSYERYCQEQYGLLPDETILETGGDFQHNLKDYFLYVMMKATRSEIAFINNGFFRFSYSDRDKATLTVRDVDRIAWGGNHIVTLRLTGKQIKSIIAKSQTLTPQASDRLQFLSIRDYGDSRAAMIHSLPLNDKETYAVTTSNFLANGGDGYAEFAQGTHPRYRFMGNLRLHGITKPGAEKVIIPELAVRYMLSNERPELANLAEWFRENSYLNRPLWLLNFSDMNLSLRDVQVHNNEALTEVKDSRVNAAAENVFNLAAGGTFSVIRLTNKLKWETSASLRHARTRTAEGGLQESDDHVEFGAIVEGRNLSGVLALPPNFNLFSGTRFETELTPTEDENGANLPRQKDFYLSAGLNFTSVFFREARLGYFGKYDFVKENLNSGFELNAQARRDFGVLDWDAGLRARYLVSNQSPTPGDELASLDLKSSIGVALTRNLSLKPALNLFVFRDKAVKQTATYLQFAVNLSYSRLWKPQYLKFIRRDEGRE